MELTINPRGVLQIDDARIIFRNFSGEAGQYNREGDRNFALVIPTQEIADELTHEGWNVRVRESRDPDGEPYMYLPVKVKFNDRGPNVYLKSGRSVNRLDESTVGMLDDIDILSVDMDIRPFDWDINGKTGRTAYLQSMDVTQNIDRFAARYESEEV